ncbi:hypothetical protein [Dietzia sp. PP-33]|uniref:hypothetical protein n=1 Tax=Dietzia sp. PP-33 TaxID=2957500 RepID=UPI0029B63E2F|nr:hypothetical protein [Dietzia sp. PP-33]MDX2358189.1 hypothetical protein [Dietzia sp. PP-33]
MSSQESDGGADRVQGDPAAPKWLAVVSVLVLVVGLAMLGLFGARYADARSAKNAATERETVSEVASQVIINAFSFDHRNVDDSLQQLADSSTGDFLIEQEQWAEDVRTRVVEQKAVTTATVSHTAVETLDTDEGDAAVLVVFTAHSEREGQDDITGRQAMRVDLTRVDDQWKADAVNQVGVTVPVGGSSQSVQDLGESGAQGADTEDTGTEDAGSEETGTEDTDTQGESTTAPTTSAGR